MIWIHLEIVTYLVYLWDDPRWSRLGPDEDVVAVWLVLDLLSCIARHQRVLPSLCGAGTGA